MLFNVRRDGTVLSAEIMGVMLKETDVQAAFSTIRGMGQTESYGTMLAAAIPDMSIYYIAEELCGIVTEKIVSRPDLDGVTTVVQSVALTINGGFKLRIFSF